MPELAAWRKPSESLQKGAFRPAREPHPGQLVNNRLIRREQKRTSFVCQGTGTESVFQPVTTDRTRILMQVLRCLPFWGSKLGKWCWRESWRRCLKRPRFASLHRVRDAMLDRHVPIGYQDETGFHYGAEDGRSEVGGGGLQQPGSVPAVEKRRRAGQPGG